MANLNYVGSVAERFMKFRSSLATEEDVSENLFNAVSIYLPKSLAENNLASGTYDPEQITADKYAVIAVTVDNYKTVFNQTGSLMTQWLKVFNDGANLAVTLYIIIFDDTGFAPVVGEKSIVWSPLTKAFNDLYFISFFKTMFSEHYDGVDNSAAETGAYDDSNYYDMAMCLSYQCELESTLSFCLIEGKVVVPADGAEDTNPCKVLSQTRGTETTNATTLVGSTKSTRAQYFWGFLLLLGFNHTEFHIHNGTFMIPIILGKWFETTNDSGEYVGNKLAKIRLTGSDVKPTGLPSPLDSDVNLNLSSTYYDNLDAKYVGYFISISGSSRNNAELIRDRNGQNYPITAYAIARWIDYNTSQDMANVVAAQSTLTNPVLTNEAAYEDMQNILVGNIQKFTGTNRITKISTNFPPFSEAKQGNKFVGTAVWSAWYIDDLEGVEISGVVNF